MEVSLFIFPHGRLETDVVFFHRANSLTDDISFSRKWLPTMMVAGASHHAWTHPPKDTDQESVKAARVAIAARVDEWLLEGPMDSKAMLKLATERRLA